MKRLMWILIFCGFIFSLGAQNLADIKVKGQYQEESLNLVLLNLELNYRLKFDYTDEIDLDVKITTSFNKIRLADALTQIFIDLPIGFEWGSGRTIHLMPKTTRNNPLVVAPSIHEPERTNFSLTGIVKDLRTGESLPFATVQISGSGTGATTNMDGYFTLFNVPNDTVVIVASYIGYQKKEWRLTPDTEIENVEILLEDFSQQLEQVVIKAINEQQMMAASTGVSRIGISPLAMANIPSYGEKDVFRSLQLLPGISGSNESSSGLYVRGGTPDQNLILFDGFTVYHVDHLFGFFSAFNPNAIKDVQLYKGGFDAKYGGRLSSVVDMTGKDGNTEEFNMGVGLSLLSFNAFVESPFAKGKGSVLVAGRRSFQSDFYTSIFDAYTDQNESENQNVNTPQGFRNRFGQQEIRPNTYFYDLNAKLTYRLSKDDIFSFSFYNGDDFLDNSRNVDQNAFFNRFGGGGSNNLNFDQQSTDLTSWGNWGASSKWAHRWNESWYANLYLSYSNYYSQLDRQDKTTILREDTTIIQNRGRYEYNDLRDFSFKWDHELQLSQQNQLDFGLQSTWNDIDYAFIQNDTNTIIDRQDQALITSLYLQDRHNIGDQWILRGGLRGSHYSITNQLYIEPRASATYLWNEAWKLKAAWGKYYQFANRIVREDIEQGSRDFWLLSDSETIPVGQAFHHILGASYETRKWLFDIEGYLKTLDGIAEYSSRITYSGFGREQSLDYEEAFYSGTGIAKGLEFLIQRKVGKLTGWLGYTLGQVQYDIEAFSDEPYFANQDVTHEFKIVSNYKWGRITLGSTFIYATGKPYTAPLGFYELTLLNGDVADFYELSDKNELRYENYHRWDLSAVYDFKLGNSKANIGLSVTNVYNRKNTWYKEYDVIEGQLLETNVTLLGTTPSLFFTWSLR